MAERRTFTPEQLREILDKHRKWRRGEADGARAYLADANLAGANLADANLAGAYLAGANLADANLAGAYLAGADLARANLADANLAGANLAGADLARANLADANLAGANLADANLARANLADADLAGADLARANLADANLAGAYLARANLAGAYLAGADLAGANNVPAELATHKDPTTPYVRRGPTPEELATRAAVYREANPAVPVVERLDAKILEAITTGPGKLDMRDWHTCATTHCRAGWAITIAGEAGRQLEDRVGSQRAGQMIYRASTGRVPWFFAPDEVALADIKACAAQQTEAAK